MSAPARRARRSSAPPRRAPGRSRARRRPGPRPSDRPVGPAFGSVRGWGGPRPGALIPRTRTLAALAVASLALGCRAEPPDPSAPLALDVGALSPEAWGDDELARFHALDRRLFEPAPVARGEHGLVAVTSSPFAARAGVEALARGGSAVDAAITTALAQVARVAGSWVSYAGIASLLVYDASTGEVYFVEGAFARPLGETDPSTLPERPTPSGRSVLVPGFVPALAAAHERFGRLPFGRLVEPAIHLAEEGFVVDPFFAWTIEHKWPVLSRRSETRAIFTRPDGERYAVGDRFLQPALAETLRRLAADGPEHMTRGEWAHAFVAAVRDAGGRLGLADLEAYEARWSTPTRVGYGEHTIALPAAAMRGGWLMAEIFGELAMADAARAACYTESPEAFHALVRALRGPRVREHYPEGSHSDGVVVVDRDGDVVALTHSINTTLWGDNGLFVGGVSIPDPAAVQQERLAELEPGARLSNGMNPLIALHAGRPVLASSAIGAALFETMAQRVHLVLDHGFDPGAAATAPVVHPPLWRETQRIDPRPGDPPSYHYQGVPAGAFDAELLDAARATGLLLEEIPDQRAEGMRGYWAAVTIDPETGERAGSATVDGYALAEVEFVDAAAR